MSLYLFRDFLNDMERDTMRPSRLIDQRFGLGITPSDMFAPLTLPARQRMLSNYYRPWSRMDSTDIGSTMHMDKNTFRVDLDVQQFAPEEIKVKVSDGYVTVEGSHEEKQDEHGFISRNFTRRYLVPEGFDVNGVASSLSTDGVLTLTAPKLQIGGNAERHIPITQTGGPHRAVKQTEETK